MRSQFIFTKCLIVVLSVGCAFKVSAEIKGKAVPAPFTSKEVIGYLSKTQQPFLDFAKSKDFIGLVQREQKPTEQIDIYSFNNVSAKKIDQTVCLQLAARVFGPLNKISLKPGAPSVEKTLRSGNICEVTLTDDDSKALFPQRQFYARMITDKAYGFVFKSKARAPAASVKEDAKAFVTELR
jgi:hypothetical protein